MDNRKKRKPKKGYNKRFDKRKDDSKFDESKYSSESGTNDPAWYAQYPELMKDSASLPYSIPTGTKLSWDINEDPSNPLIKSFTGPDSVAYQSVPGIMTLGIVPTVGVSVDATSPINVASKLLYTKVRAENSGAKNYDPADLTLYCLAMDQIYSFITWMNRIYGIVMLYSQVNRYLPAALLKAQHVDFDDLLVHINDFKTFTDMATAQAAAFAIPADIKLFHRHAYMYQNVYKDAESAKSQLYQFAPRVFYQYDEMNGPGKLVPIDVIATYPNGLGLADFVDLYHKLMDPIVASEDFNIMSGDILKAFGESNLLKLQLMPDGYTIIPITDYEVLTQIKNATITNLSSLITMTMASDPDNWSIKQDANAEFLVWNPYITIGQNTPHYLSADRFLSTYKTTPEPADNMVYTRLMWTRKNVTRQENGNTVYDTYFDAVGSEFVVGCVVTQFYQNTNFGWTLGGANIETMSENPISSLGQATNMYKLWASKHFDFCPALYIYWTTGNLTRFYPFFDLDNWTIVHGYELEKMHRTAIMSMLRVPMIGSALSSSPNAVNKK